MVQLGKDNESLIIYLHLLLSFRTLIVWLVRKRFTHNINLDNSNNYFVNRGNIASFSIYKLHYTNIFLNVNDNGIDNI
jgi:hypothetical protein